jgi:signal transduction histidine kinase
MRIKYIYQQFISHMSVIVIAFLVLSLLFAHYIETLVYQNKVDELTSYGSNILRELENQNVSRPQTIAQYRQVLFGRNIHFSVFDEKGNILFPIGRRSPDNNLTAMEWKRITKGEEVIVKKEVERFDAQGVSLVALPLMVNDTFSGGIILTSSISGSREMISQINRYLLITVLIALAISILLSWLLARIQVKRIKEIQEATSLVSAGDYTVRVPSSNFDEIGELAKDFNQMVDKINDSMLEIESLESRRRNFMSDVSHELRTPLTTISGVIEGMKNNAIPEEEKDKGIQLVSQETKRLIRLVNENLDYDRIRSNQIKLSKESIPLMEVFEVIKEHLAFQAEEKNNKITIEAEETILVYADYDRLIQILINITKNSIQFTSNGLIQLKGKAGYKETIIEIKDSGMGIDAKEVEKIWHRFYKAEISRTSNPYGAFGLGLSIVKQLVQLHEGEVNVVSEKDKGTTFVIRLPLEKCE